MPEHTIEEDIHAVDVLPGSTSSKIALMPLVSRGELKLQLLLPEGMPQSVAPVANNILDKSRTAERFEVVSNKQGTITEVNIIDSSTLITARKSPRTAEIVVHGFTHAYYQRKHAVNKFLLTKAGHGSFLSLAGELECKTTGNKLLHSRGLGDTNERYVRRQLRKVTVPEGFDFTDYPATRELLNLKQRLLCFISIDINANSWYNHKVLEICKRY